MEDDDMYKVLREIRDNAENWCRGREDTPQCKGAAQWVQGFDQISLPAAAPQPPVVNEDAFSRTVSQLRSSISCLTEESLRRPNEDRREVIEAEKDRIMVLEDKLTAIARGAGQRASQSPSDDTNTPITPTAVTGSSVTESSVPESSVPETATSEEPIHTTLSETTAVETEMHLHDSSGESHKKEAHQRNAASIESLNSAVAQQMASQTYAKLYYTRLVFWLILTIMVIFFISHLAMGGSTSILASVGGIILLLFVLYYLVQFGYRKYL